MHLDTHTHAAAEAQQPAGAVLLVSSISLQDNYQRVRDANFKGFGIHPMCAGEFREADLPAIERMVDSTPGSFIGEIGLDMRQSVLAQNSLEAQKQCFEHFARLAFAKQKLISLHVVNRAPGCWDYLLYRFGDLEKEFGGVAIIFHGFSGSAEVFERFYKACRQCRFFAGFGWLNCERRKVFDRIKQHVVLETDVSEPSQDYAALWRTACQFACEEVRASEEAVFCCLSK